MSGDELRGRVKQLLGELAYIDGVAGHEQAVVKRLQDLFDPLCDAVEIDSFGNLFARLNPPNNGPRSIVSRISVSDKLRRSAMPRTI